MSKLNLSEIYAVGIAVLLVVMLLVDNALFMLIAAGVGLVAGLLVVRRGDYKRVALVAAVSCAAALAIALVVFFRAS